MGNSNHLTFTPNKGAAGATGLAEFENRETGRDITEVSAGIGDGVEIPILSASSDRSWSNFETNTPITFEDFSGSMVRFTHIDVGIGPAGYSIGYFTFVSHMDENVDFSEFVMN